MKTLDDIKTARLKELLTEFEVQSGKFYWERDQGSFNSAADAEESRNEAVNALVKYLKRTKRD